MVYTYILYYILWKPPQPLSFLSLLCLIVEFGIAAVRATPSLSLKLGCALWRKTRGYLLTNNGATQPLFPNSITWRVSVYQRSKEIRYLYHRDFRFNFQSRATLVFAINSCRGATIRFSAFLASIVVQQSGNWVADWYQVLFTVIGSDIYHIITWDTLLVATLHDFKLSTRTI